MKKIKYLRDKSQHDYFREVKYKINANRKNTEQNNQMLRIRDTKIHNKYKWTKKPSLKDQILSLNKQRKIYKCCFLGTYLNHGSTRSKEKSKNISEIKIKQASQ